MAKVYPTPPFEGAVAIYQLRDPRTQAIRYIGKSLNPWQRLDAHMVQAKDRPHLYTARWLMTLKAEGLRPILEIIEWATSDVWRDAERRRIAEARMAGINLTNATDGGDGSLGCKPTAEVREKMRQAQRERWAQHPDLRVAFSAFHKGVDRTGLTREQRAATTKKWWDADPDRRRQASETAKALLDDPDRRQKNATHLDALHHDLVRRQHTADANRRRARTARIQPGQLPLPETI